MKVSRGKFGFSIKKTSLKSLRKMASIPDAAKENNNKLELTQAQLNDLMEATGFTEEEIREMYEGMQGKFPSSGLTEVEFLSMFDESATDSNDRMFVSPKDIFAITDRDHSGKISLYEYILTVGLFGKNDSETATNCLFQLCDTDHDGFTSQADIVDLWATLLGVTNKDTKESDPAKEEDELEEIKSHVRNAFGDKTQVSQQEFRQFCSENEAIEGLTQGLQIYVVMPLGYLGAAFN